MVRCISRTRELARQRCPRAGSSGAVEVHKQSLGRCVQVAALAWWTVATDSAQLVESFGLVDVY